MHHGTRRQIDEEIGSYEGILASVPARAIWEVACRSSLEGGVVTADSALHRSPELKESLDALHDCFALFPGSVKARTVLRLADGRSDSPGESVSRVQFHRYGIPMPEPQFHVIGPRGELIGIADFYWEDFRHLGEFDGKIKYQKLLRPGESASDCVFREKRREDAMRAGSRGMTRFTWSDVMPRYARRTMTDLRPLLISHDGCTYGAERSSRADRGAGQSRAIELLRPPHSEPYLACSRCTRRAGHVQRQHPTQRGILTVG